jgi:NAD(P)-dependent dehydrogenase (short-subunit alcohol dehydrogenase family)
VTVVLPATPSFSLEGRRAVVTGAGRGLGVGIAAALARAGAAVTLVARSEQEIKAVAEAIRARGDRAEAVVLDVLDGEAVRRFFTEKAAFDILVNNAGTNRPKPVTEVTEADYDAVLALNLRSSFFVAQAAARRMIDAEVRGSLIHVGSQMGHVGGRNRTLYCASKWGLEGMSKAMALDLAPYRIRSNTIAPTFIETPMTAPFFEDVAFRAEVLGKIKLGRFGRVEDLLGAIVFLASEASALVTGTSLVIDGGWTAD